MRREPTVDPRMGTGNTVAFQTLGCKLNQYETDSLAAQFQNAGYRLVPFSQPAQVYIINTCTVTNKADRKSRNTINRALRQSSDFILPDDKKALVVVTGCFANSSKDDLEKDGRTFVVENDQKTHIFQLVQAQLRGEIVHPHQLPKEVFQFTTQDQSFHTRGMVKIQDGCDNFCTFCIIPFVRGRGISRPLPEILSEARSLIQRGYREIVLTGVNMSRYSWEGVGFSRVLEELLNLEIQPNQQDFRLRISSLEPDQIDGDFFRIIDHPRMMPHLHLCLQSGSERILLAMRRQYTRKEFEVIAEKLREKNPLFNLTTDIILGFPGESEEEFSSTLDAVTSIGFGHVHLFPYSRREGTRADRMDHQVTEGEKNRRSQVIQRVAIEEKISYRKKLIGTIQEVIVEGAQWINTGDHSEGILARGLGQHYVPVHFHLPPTRNPRELRNHLFQVQIVDLAEGDDPFLVGAVGDY